MLERNRTRMVPKEENAYDCGVFIAYIVLYRACGLVYDFEESDTDKLREHLLLTLLAETPFYC